MADTQRTKAAILTLFADNVTGSISEQDLRDFVVSIMQTEFVNPTDFWKQPDKANVSADSGRGWIDHSETIDSGCSFGNVMALTPSNTWRPANASTSTMNPGLGVALDSYTSGISTADILRWGLIKHSVFSASFNGLNGRPVYLGSANSLGSITASIPTNKQILGTIEDEDNGVWRFWPVLTDVLGT